LTGGKLNTKESDLPFTTRELLRLYKQDEFIPYIVFGGLGYGKSSYAIQCLALAYGEDGEPDWKAVRKRIIFTPEEFLDAITKYSSKKDRDIALIWDDAGVWFYSLDYYTPLVKAVTKYLSVARTDLASIIFTSPNPRLMAKGGRTMPNTRLARIVKYSTEEYIDKDGKTKFYRYRKAVVYQSWESPDGKRSGVKTIYNDNFNATLPEEVYNWYKPIRDKYASIVKRMITDEIEKKKYQAKLSKKIGKDEKENAG